MEFRSKSPGRVVEEIACLAKQYRRLDFQIVDNILDRRYFTDVLPRLRQAGHNVSLFCETKANLKREEVQLLKEAGVDSIQPGLESLSTPILKLMRKGVTAFQNVRLLKWCAQYGVRVHWNLIYGIAGEPVEEYARMAELMPSLTHLQPPTLGCIVLDRFSPYHQRPGDFGLEILGPRPHYRFIYPVEEETLADLAYVFEYRHADGRDPAMYVEPVRRAVEVWQANRESAFRSLRYRRGPGFLIVSDRRPNLEAADYSFGEVEALIHLACEDGATVAEAFNATRVAGMTDVSPDDVWEFLDDLVESRLAFEEGGRYLALALPANLTERL
jgi:ribosomal peptide maturation radical SAM protein 1